MLFGYPQLIFLMILPVLIICLFIAAYNKRQRMLEAFASKALLETLLASYDGRKRWLRAGFIVAALTLCVLSLMRPQFGLTEEKEKKIGYDIIIAVDVSKSMLAQDAGGSRLAQAKMVAARLTSQMQGSRIGLIAFSGSAFLMCPLTVDYDAYMLTFDSLDIQAVPGGGTSLSAAIAEAVKGFKSASSKAPILLIISDGEDHEGNPAPAAVEAGKAGMYIFTIGVGTEAGELITVKDGTGGHAFLKDRQGNIIKTRLNEENLKRIAAAAGGRYIRMGQRDDNVQAVFADWVGNIEKQEMAGGTKKRYKEWFQLPLALALLFLMGEAFVSEGRDGHSQTVDREESAGA
jgi:Ca-activated chloride channel family protein